MRYQQFQAVSDHSKNLFNPEIYLKVGTIEIKDVHYAISPEQFIYIQVSTNHPAWVSIVNRYEPIKNCSSGLVLVNSDELCQDDVYDIYILRDDVDITNNRFAQLENLLVERSHLAPHQNDTAVIHWNLVSSLDKKAGMRSVSIRHQPMDCPLCGKPLETDDDSGESFCANNDCKVHRYSAICRYLNVACKLPQYQPLCKRFIDAGIIQTIPDLYTTLLEYLRVEDQSVALSSEIREHEKRKRWKKFGTVQEIQAFIDDLQDTIGTLKFSDWLQSFTWLPDFNYMIIEDTTKLRTHQIEKGMILDYICPDSLDERFQEYPDHFAAWIAELFQAYIAYSCGDSDFHTGEESLQLWKNEYGTEIETVMSIPIFFHFADLDAYLTDAIQQLLILNLFAPVK